MIESRHLGLMLPGEIEGLRERIGRLAEQMEESLDMEGLIALARRGRRDRKPAGTPSVLRAVSSAVCRVRIGVARDQAFCFYYQENLRLMEELGAELVFFSPLSDRELPEADGYLFGGGYPENFAKELSENRQMLNSVRQAHRRGKQILAECGGFLYLHRLLEGADGKEYELAGLVDASACRTNRLSRFGYIELEGPDGEMIKGHEFHYWETQLEGGDWIARKPLSDRSWRCMVQTDTLLCGFPHLYYPSNEGWLKKWLLQAAERKILR